MYGRQGIFPRTCPSLRNLPAAWSSRSPPRHSTILSWTFPGPQTGRTCWSFGSTFPGCSLCDHRLKCRKTLTLNFAIGVTGLGTCACIMEQIARPDFLVSVRSLGWCIVGLHSGEMCRRHRRNAFRHYSNNMNKTRPYGCIILWQIDKCKLDVFLLLLVLLLLLFCCCC